MEAGELNGKSVDNNMDHLRNYDSQHKIFERETFHVTLMANN